MKTYQQKFREQLHKAKYKCEDCGGDGFDRTKFTGTTEKPHIIHPDCKTCSGRGFNIPVELGTEFKRIRRKIDGTFDENDYSLYTAITDRGFANNPDKLWVIEMASVVFGRMTVELNKDMIDNGANDKWEVLGKPITLQEILWLLSKKEISFQNAPQGFPFNSKDRAKICIHTLGYEVDLPLNQDPKDYPENVYEKLLEIIN